MQADLEPLCCITMRWNKPDSPQMTGATASRLEPVARPITHGNTRRKRLIITQLTVLTIMAISCIYLFRPRPLQVRALSGLPIAVPTNVNIILDTSASMQGYLNGRTELKNKVAELVAQIDELRDANRGLKSVTYQFAADDGTITDSGYSSREFIERLLNDKLMSGQASLLQDVFRNAVAKTDKNTVSLLITDSIFSYGDKAIRANPEINKNNIPILASEITLTFNQAKATGISVSLLAARSTFGGKYYTYRNVARACCNVPRPYYIWVMGEASHIRGLLDFLQKRGATYEHRLDFNLATIELPVAICQHTQNKGTWYTDSRDMHHIEDVEPGKEDLVFALALDLSVLPQELSTTEFLNDHLLAQSSEIHVKKKMIYSRAAFENSVDHRDAKKLSSYTHVLILTVDNSFVKHATINLFLEDAVPDWYMKWSNEDDAGDDPQTSSTTFGLKEIVNGVALSYKRAEPIAKVTLSLDR